MLCDRRFYGDWQVWRRLAGAEIAEIDGSSLSFLLPI
jgi:hypothetical protein